MNPRLVNLLQNEERKYYVVKTNQNYFDKYC